MQKTSLKILGMTALFLCVSCIEQSGTKAVDERVEIAEAYNPLNFCGYTPLNSGITVQTPDGDYLYNEKDAEEYYDYYVTSFFFALKIADRLNPSWSSYSSTKHETKEYVRNNLFDIVSNLPLDDSYPNDVVEFVNKIYYDNDIFSQINNNENQSKDRIKQIKREIKDIFLYQKLIKKNIIFRLFLHEFWMSYAISDSSIINLREI